MQNTQVIFSWKAPLRPYKKRSRLVLRFYLAVALLLSLIVFFFGDKILLIPIWSVLFLFYTLTITPPPEVENKITKFGLENAGTTFRWEALSHFYFSKRFGFQMVTIISHAPYFFRVYLVLPNDGVKKNLMLILSEHLVYQEKPHKTLTDKMIDWFSKLIPSDEEEPEVKKASRPISSSKAQPASP